jgi:hypothetical protein
MRLAMKRVQPWICAQCGERIEEQLTTCWNCGTGKDGLPPEDRQGFKFAKEMLVIPPAPSSNISSPPPAADLSPDHKHTFDLLYQSDELKELLQYTPSSTRPMAWSTFWISLGLVFVTLAIIGRFESTATVVLIVLGAYPLIIGMYDLMKFGASPLKRLPAIVIHKSKKVYPGYKRGGSGGAILLVFIETRDGHMQHYHVSLKLFLKIEQEDIGIAYIRGEHILDFKKITLRET